MDINGLVSSPGAPDGAHCEVGVDDGRAIQRVEGHRVAAATHGV